MDYPPAPARRGSAGGAAPNLSAKPKSCEPSAAPLAPIDSRNLIASAQAISKSINKLHRKKQVPPRMIRPNIRNALVFWSRRSDALYQGTTLVGPLDGPQKIWALECA